MPRDHINVKTIVKGKQTAFKAFHNQNESLFGCINYTNVCQLKKMISRTSVKKNGALRQKDKKWFDSFPKLNS